MPVDDVLTRPRGDVPEGVIRAPEDECTDIYPELKRYQDQKRYRLVQLKKVLEHPHLPLPVIDLTEPGIFS